MTGLRGQTYIYALFPLTKPSRASSCPQSNFYSFYFDDLSCSVEPTFADIASGVNRFNCATCAVVEHVGNCLIVGCFDCASEPIDFSFWNDVSTETSHTASESKCINASLTPPPVDVLVYSRAPTLLFLKKD